MKLEILVATEWEKCYQNGTNYWFNHSIMLYMWNEYLKFTNSVLNSNRKVKQKQTKTVFLCLRSSDSFEEQDF